MGKVNNTYNLIIVKFLRNALPSTSLTYLWVLKCDNVALNIYIQIKFVHLLAIVKVYQFFILNWLQRKKIFIF